MSTEISEIDFSSLKDFYSVQTSKWGPFTKRYMGISHVPDESKGLRFDFSVFPGIYRRKIKIPSVKWDSDFHYWKASSDHTYFSTRNQIIWKDQIYADIEYSVIDDNTVIICSNLHNKTNETQSIELDYVAYLNFPPIRTYSDDPLYPGVILNSEHAIWIDALEYTDIEFKYFDPKRNLVEDGHLLGEEFDHNFISGRFLGNKFGQHEGDNATYTIDNCENNSHCYLRFLVIKGASFTMKYSVDGVTIDKIITGAGKLELVDLGLIKKNSKIQIESSGGVDFKLDGLFIANPEEYAKVEFSTHIWNHVPQIIRENNIISLKFDALEETYNIITDNTDDIFFREFFTDNLDEIMKYMVNDHVKTKIEVNDKGHFANLCLKPINLKPNSILKKYVVITKEKLEKCDELFKNLLSDSSSSENQLNEGRKKAINFKGNTTGKEFEFSVNKLASTIVDNIVYPVRTRGQWIKHFAPGRWWDCLYTWDSGFIGLGMTHISIDKAIGILNTYMTEVGDFSNSNRTRPAANKSAAFIHHGSPVPVQHYLYQEIWNQTQSKDLLNFFYAKLKQYYDFFTGEIEYSTIRMKTDILRTYDYFYNSGGWDDYAPQKYRNENEGDRKIAPVINTAHIIRVAKILRTAANILNISSSDIDKYNSDIAAFTKALNQYSWDPEVGYFSYMIHSQEEEFLDHLRTDNGENFNKGLDGLTPLISDILTEEQFEVMISHLFDPEKIWTDIGLTAIDQSASYYLKNGYWNGTVWFPHQWFFWKAMFDYGLSDKAFKIAETALNVWKKEVEDTYNCYEHFVIESGRGAGWNQFGGLSSPLVNWYNAYFVPGTITTGYNTWILNKEFNKNFSELSLNLLHDSTHTKSAIVVVMNEKYKYQVNSRDKNLTFKERHPGTLEIDIEGKGEIQIQIKTNL